jgi:hypothetical protein
MVLRTMLGVEEEPEVAVALALEAQEECGVLMVCHTHPVGATVRLRGQQILEMVVLDLAHLMYHMLVEVVLLCSL